MPSPLIRPLRRIAARAADAIADRVAARLVPAAGPDRPEGTQILLEYQVHPRPRYGYGRPPHPEVVALLDRGRDRYRHHLERIVTHAERLRRIEPHAADPTEPAWVNDYIPGLDGAALYAFVADRIPAVYFEVGSGNSTRFVRRATRDGNLATRIVSVDPSPRAEVDALCDEVIRVPLEDADLGVLDQLKSGDVVFVDNSHRVLPNSDATVVFLELFPRLPPGVLIGLHDIFLPEDYPPDWNDRFYSEQYALATFLLGGHAGFQIELPAWYASRDPELAAVTAPLWEAPGLSVVQQHGGTFWMSTVDG
jgi:hypothetical protein